MSSAKNRDRGKVGPWKLLSIASARGSIKTLNSHGARTEPWNKPRVFGMAGVRAPLTAMWQAHPVNKEWRREVSAGANGTGESRIARESKRDLRGTLSYAAAISRNIQSWLPVWYMSEARARWALAENPRRNPPWVLENEVQGPWEAGSLHMALRRIFSKARRSIDVKEIGREPAAFRALFGLGSRWVTAMFHEEGVVPHSAHRRKKAAST
jgi:hypothetical protein